MWEWNYCPTSHLCIYMPPSILYNITDNEYIYPVRPIQSVLERNTFHGMQYRHVCRYVLCMVMSGKLNTIPSLAVYLIRVPLLCPFLIELLGQNTLALLLLIDFLFFLHEHHLWLKLYSFPGKATYVCRDTLCKGIQWWFTTSSCLISIIIVFNYLM